MNIELNNNRIRSLGLILLLIGITAFQVKAQVTYYSSNTATQPLNWDDAASWTLNSDGSGGGAGIPTRIDNVFILSGHEVIVDEVDDNQSPGQSADGLGLANVGAGSGGSTFPDSSTPNFFHKGDMTVEEGAILTFSERVMFDGTIFIAGTLNTSKDIINIGNFYFAPSASFSSMDDLICSGNSYTRIDIPDVSNSWTSDDIYLDHTDAFVCGLGKLEIGITPGPTRIINLNNGADYDQICMKIIILGCDDANLCKGTGDNPSDAATLAGTGGSFTYIENDIDVIDAGITITHSATFEPFMTSATISITAGYSLGQDTLVLPPPYGIVSSFDSSTGVLTLRGFGTLATWEAVLKSVTFEILSDNPSTTTRTVEFEISDGFVSSNTISRDINVTAVNDPPDVSTITGTPTPLAYAEGDGAVAVDTQIAVDDPDDTNMESATISIGSYVPGEDFLDFSDAFGVTKVGFNTTTGVLTLTGSSLLADYASALSTVSYENISDTPDLTPRTVTFVVNDGDANSPGFGRVINISATNDVPIITGTVTALTYTEGDGAVLLDAGVTVADADDANLASATITIGSYTNPEDILTFSNQNGISGVYASGVLTLTGSSSPANYQTAIRSITYTNTSEAPNTTTRTVSFVLNDGTGNSLSFTRDIIINPVNDLPTIAGTVTDLTYTEGDGAVIIDGGVTVADADNANLASAIITIGSYMNPEDILTFTNQNGIGGVYASGVLTLTGSASPANYQTAIRSITYTNTSEDPNNTTRSVSFILNDGTGNSLTFTRDIIINPVNDAPVATDLAVSTDEDVPLDIDLNTLVSDIDDALDLTTINITGPTNGATSTNTTTGVVTYTPTLNYNGGDSFTYTIDDATGAPSNSGTITVTVNPINDLPLIGGTGTALTYTEGDGAVLLDAGVTVADADDPNLASATITIGSYTNPEDILTFSNQNGIGGVYAGGVLTLTGSASPANYQTAIRSITYTNTSEAPNSATRTVSFILNDGTGNSLTFTRDIIINPVNDVPVATDLAVSTDEDVALDIDLKALVTDVDDALNLTSISITGPSNGTITNINTATGVVTYSPTLDYNGSDSFNYTINDMSGGTSNSGTITITINPLNDAPVATDLAVSTAEDVALDINLGVLVSDVDDALNLTTISITGPTNGATNINTTTGVVTYTPSLNYNGGDSFTYTINDVTGETSNSGTITITVNPINDVPVATDLAVSTDEDVALDIDLSALVTDIDDAVDLATINIIGPTNGIITNIDAITGVVTYAPNPNYVGGDSFTYTINDGSGGTSNSGTITITVNPLNDAPVATDLAASTDEDTALDIDLTVLVSDIDDAVDLATINITGPTNGVITNINTTTGVVTYTPTLNYVGGDSFNYTIDDVSGGTSNTGTITITVNPLNDVPEAADHSVSTDEDVALNIDLSALVTDVDDAVDLTTLNVNSPGSGTITNINTTTGVVNYLPNPNYNGGDSFTYTIDDMTGGTSNSGTVSITVNSINDLPMISGASSALTYTEGDGQVAIDNSILIDDIDGTTISSATITISANYTSVEDELNFNNQLGIIGTYSNGVLSLTGIASIADYRTALSVVTYENTSVTPNAATRTVEFVVNDGFDNSLGFNRDIIVIPNAEPTVITIISGGNTLAIDYTEGDGAIAINTGLNMSDPDDVNLEGATINFTNNYIEGEDILAFNNQSGITGVFDVSSGTLTLTGTATLSDYQSAVLAITYENTSDNPSTQSRTLEERVFDGDVLSNAITLTINVIPVNDPPELVGQAEDLQYSESSGPLPIDNMIEVTDIDNDNLVSATVRISTNYTGTEDVLEFNNQNGITGSFDSSSGSILMSGTATKEDYQTAIRSITYTNLSERAFLGDREVEFIVNDGEADSDPFFRIIVLEEVIDPVIVYQVVTPDGDMMNDTWVIDGIEQYPNNNVRIFNRWNSLVYKKASYENDMAPWAGETNEGLSGAEAKDGTYFYTVDLGDGSDIIEGFLVLKRR